MKRERPPPGREPKTTQNKKRSPGASLSKGVCGNPCLSTISIVAHTPAKHKMLC